MALSASADLVARCAFFALEELREREDEKRRREEKRGEVDGCSAQNGQEREKRNAFRNSKRKRNRRRTKVKKKAKNLQARAAFSDQQPTRRSEPWSGARFFFRLEWNTTLLLKWGACKALVSTLFPSLLPFRYWEA